ncbi:hypothetical protein HanIR_Chr01g0045861 [Helianthus annuus]|nr:hypothetical protein HanIR_Chr01g0045861 [Helianthus annuus]
MAISPAAQTFQADTKPFNSHTLLHLFSSNFTKTIKASIQLLRESSIMRMLSRDPHVPKYVFFIICIYN